MRRFLSIFACTFALSLVVGCTGEDTTKPAADAAKGEAGERPTTAKTRKGTVKITKPPMGSPGVKGPSTGMMND